MAKWQRSFFQPVLPLGEDGRRVTGSKEHIALSRMAAGEGMVVAFKWYKFKNLQSVSFSILCICPIMDTSFRFLYLR